MNREHEELNFSPGVIVDYISRLTHKQTKKTTVSMLTTEITDLKNKKNKKQK